MGRRLSWKWRIDGRSAVWITGGLFAGYVALTPSTVAGVPTPWDLHSATHQRMQEHLQQMMELPRQMHAEHVRLFQSFVAGRVYSSRHRHYHTSYRLPVDTGSGVVYRTYFYCGDRLQLDADVPLPRLAIRAQVGSSLATYDAPTVAYSSPVVYETPAIYTTPTPSGPACSPRRPGRANRHGLSGGSE